MTNDQDRHLIASLLHDLNQLRSRMKDLTKDRSMRDARFGRELDDIISEAHQLRGHLRTVDERSKHALHRLLRERTGFSGKDRAYRDARLLAERMQHDEFAADRELAVVLTTIQHLDRERHPEAISTGVIHLLHELKHLESLLKRLLADLRNSHLPS